MRILLADDNPSIRSALTLLLELRSRVQVVAEAADAQDAIDKVNRYQPDCVVLDWELPGLNQSAGIAVLRKIQPEMKLIVLSARPEASGEAKANHVDAFVSKTSNPEALLAAIDRLCNREIADV